MGMPFAGADQQEPRDLFDREVDFINSLLDRAMFSYANMALDELRAMFPDDQDRMPVAEASILLRQGRTGPVEEMLRGKDIARDPKAQAILLQLAMTFDAQGNTEAARERYMKFIQVNEGREIEDPDVLRFFAGAGMRLSALLQAEGRFEEAGRVLRKVMEGEDSGVLRRKFRIMLIQNSIDHALSLQGTPRNQRLAEAESEINEILWGANDNYWFMAMAQRAWLKHIRGDSNDALQELNSIVPNAREMETELERAGVPRSEFPRAIIRYVQGTILFDAAKAAQREGNDEAAKQRAAQAANQFYNTFLQYEGNEYARRGGLRFEEVRQWLRETYDREINIGQQSPEATERIFRRELDRSEELLRVGNTAEAERIILAALTQYPVTRYTQGALNTLGRIWMDQKSLWQLMMLAEHLADEYPDDDTVANMLLRYGRLMLDEEHEFGIETVLGAFGRNFPGHPNAPVMLFSLGTRAQDRGDLAAANRFFDEVVQYHPGNRMATRVLTQRGAEALRARNFDEAIVIFEQVRDQALPGFQRAQAIRGLADAKLRSDDPELQRAGLQELRALKQRLQPSDDSIYYRGADAERSANLLESVRFNIAQALIRMARQEGNEEYRNEAAEVLARFREDYPRSESMPGVMSSLGRIFLQQGRFDSATEMFNELSRRFPESDEGRDALFALVRAAIEENQLDVARDAVSRMVEQPDAYTDEQIFQVSQLMYDYDLFEEARRGFELALNRPRAAENQAFRQRSLLGLGRASISAGQLERGVQVLEDFIEEFPNNAMVVDAGIMLADAYLGSEPPNPQGARTALQHVGRILRSRRNPVDQARLDIALGQIALAEGNVGSALADFYRVGVSRPESPAHGEQVKRAIELGLAQAEPMARAGETDKWSLIVDLTQQFIDNFPLDRRAEQMRSLNIRAIGLAQD
jgi:TolA-binding protein